MSEPHRASVEQLCRDILSKAIEDGVVGETDEYDDPDPQCRSAGEMGCVVAVLNEFLARGFAERKRLREVCQAVVADAREHPEYWDERMVSTNLVAALRAALEETGT